MAEEQEPKQSDTQDGADPGAVTAAEPKNTEQPTDAQGHMIPKSRFDEVNNELKQLRQQQEQANAEREAAEQERLKEQKKYQELYEQERAKREAEEARVKSLEMNALRREVATEKKLPPVLAERLQGETREELEADAETLLKSLPKPQAPPLDGGAGKDSKGQPNAPTPAMIREQAARLNVSARHLAEQYGVSLSE